MQAGIETLGRLTAKFGVASVTCDATTAAADVLQLADANLERALSANGNRIVAGEPVLNA